MDRREELKDRETKRRREGMEQTQQESKCMVESEHDRRSLRNRKKAEKKDTKRRTGTIKNGRRSGTTETKAVRRLGLSEGSEGCKKAAMNRRHCKRTEKIKRRTENQGHSDRC